MRKNERFSCRGRPFNEDRGEMYSFRLGQYLAELILLLEEKIKGECFYQCKMVHIDLKCFVFLIELDMQWVSRLYK